MTDTTESKPHPDLYAALKTSARTLQKEQLLLFTAMLGFVSMALLVSNVNVSDYTELVNTHIGLRQFMACILAAGAFHAPKNNWFARVQTTLFRWRPLRKSPKSGLYTISIRSGKILAALLVLMYADARINPYVKPLSVKHAYEFVQTVLSCSALTVGVLAGAGLWSGVVQQDPRDSKMPKCDLMAFDIKQAAVTVTESVIAVYGIYLPVKAIVGHADSTFAYCLTEGFCALLFGLMHEQEGLAYVALASFAGLIYNQSFRRTGTLLAPILTHYLVNRAHFSDINFTSGLPDWLRLHMAPFVNPEHVGMHFTYPHSVIKHDCTSPATSQTLAGLVAQRLLSFNSADQDPTTSNDFTSIFRACNLPPSVAPSSSSSVHNKKHDKTKSN